MQSLAVMIELYTAQRPSEEALIVRRHSCAGLCIPWLPRTGARRELLSASIPGAEQEQHGNDRCYICQVDLGPPPPGDSHPASVTQRRRRCACAT